MAKHSKSETNFRQLLLISFVSIISIIVTLAFSGKIFKDEYEFYQNERAPFYNGILLNKNTGQTWMIGEIPNERVLNTTPHKPINDNRTTKSKGKAFEGIDLYEKPPIKDNPFFDVDLAK